MDIPLFQHHLLKRISFRFWNYFGILVENQWTEWVWVYLWSVFCSLCPVPLGSTPYRLHLRRVTVCSISSLLFSRSCFLSWSFFFFCCFIKMIEISVSIKKKSRNLAEIFVWIVLASLYRFGQNHNFLEKNGKGIHSYFI